MRKRILAAAMAVAVVAATLAFRLWPRTLSPVQCGEPYRRYAGSDIVRASFIKDKRINDSVSVDVTLLEAVGDSGWVVLDYVDVIVHAFTHEAREYYDLDSLYKA